MRWDYRLGVAVVRAWFTLAHRLRVLGEVRMPETGGFILASNHASYLDPPLLGVALRRRELHFLARATLFRHPCFGALIRHFNAHPIDRGAGPRQTWEAYVKLLAAGNALLVFPEGTRSPDGRLQPGRTGFARLAHMSGRPVYPAHIQGSHRAWPKHGRYRFTPITVRFGPPVPVADLQARPGDKRVLRELSARTMAAIAALAAEAEAAPDRNPGGRT